MERKGKQIISDSINGKKELMTCILHEGGPVDTIDSVAKQQNVTA